MAVASDQVEVNGLMLGSGTRFVITQFNPYVRSVRHTQADLAWGPGSWSGREDPEAVAIPLRLVICESDDASWLEALNDLRSALRASSADVELRWTIGTTEYLMFVRPRLVEPETDAVNLGKGKVACALMALDPRIYGATLKQVVLGLPSTTGGLTVPFTVPFSINATTTSGRVSITNGGREETALSLRIDAFGSTLVEPRVTLVSGSSVKVLRCNLTLTSGQWLELDTGNKTAYLNGTASRRGYVSGDWPLLPEGTSELVFDAGAYSAVAQLTASWRDTW